MCRTISLTLVLVSLALPSFAQRITASIRGTVTDATAAVVPGASVTGKNEETGFTRSTVTNGAGAQSFAELPTGTGTPEVSLSGFTSAIRKRTVLNGADVLAEDVQPEA